MLKIQILGSGCPNCTKLYEMAKEAATAAGVEFEIEKVQDIQKIMEFNILATPALVINGEVKVAGRVPSLDEVKKHLGIS
jgi:small redox-active disulfide protein 2